MMIRPATVPPIGVPICTDTLVRGKRIRARARWTESGVRRSRSITVDSESTANEFFSALKTHAGKSDDPYIELGDYLDQIGDRFLRGVDMTSTASGYRAGLRLRVLPMLGHLRVRDITTGIVDRSIDRWELEHSQSTVKNTVAALTRALDEAVRDETIARNPVRDRANRRHGSQVIDNRQIPIPSLTDVERIAVTCAKVHQSYADHVRLSALLAARCSEVAGLVVGDIDWNSKLVTIERQCFPGAGGLIVKPTKSRRARHVPIIEALEPTLRHLTTGRAYDEPLLRGPRGGVITTAAFRNATRWDSLVAEIGLRGLRRHDLRHAGATWFANAGVPIHVVSDILGHGSIETTRAYLHTDTIALTRAAGRLNQHFKEMS